MPPASLRKLAEIPATRLGTDYYTPTTPNDSRVVGGYHAPTRGGDFPRRRQPEAVKTRAHEGPATFTHDGHRLVFTRPIGDESDGAKTAGTPPRLRLYTAETRNGGWVNLRELPFNGPDFSCGHPTFSPDDTYLYFASDRPGGFGGTDLYGVAFVNGTWSPPVNLGPTVNGRGDEVFPVTDEHGNLYFSSDGHPGLGGLDLFFVEMANGQPRGAVTHLGEPFNSPHDDFGLLTDGERREGFFSSNRQRGDDNIYRFVREVAECHYLTLTVLDASSGEPLDSVAVTASLRSGYAETRPTLGGGHLSLCLDADQAYTIRTERAGFLPTLLNYSTKPLAENRPGRLEILLEKAPEPASPGISRRSAGPGSGTQTADAEPGISRLQGTVRGADGQPLEGVLVRLTSDGGGPEQRVVTGPEGTYAFFTVEDGEYTLEATRVGYGVGRNRIRRKPTLAVKAVRPPVAVLQKMPAAEPRMPVAPPKIPSASPVPEAADLSLWRVGDVVLTAHLDFAPGQATLPAGATWELDNLVATLKKHPSLALEIRTHTDSRGDAGANRALSQRRAEAVLAYLIGKKIGPNRLKVSG